jgi:excinuclease ABC subunit C
MPQIGLQSKIKALPNKPGVYKYFDQENQIIYIGKAKNLRKRVSSYFVAQSQESRKTKLLVAKICDIQYTVVDTETDALLLENNLIKEFQPKYNILLKDDKSFPLIKIVNERFPRVFSMRNPTRDGGEYFGPYTSSRVMHTVLELVKKLYPTRNCNYNLSEANIQAGKFKPCLEYQIGNCLGPCAGLQSEQNYSEAINHIKHLLKGNLSEVREHIKIQMEDASEKLDFEAAEKYKQKLILLDNYKSRSTVVNPKINNVDVFTLSMETERAFVNFLKVANGMIIQTHSVEYKLKLDESEQEILQRAILDIRQSYSSVAAEVLVPFNPKIDLEGVKFVVPKVGDKKKLLDLSLKNVLYYKREKIGLYQKIDPEHRSKRLMEQMKADLKLKDLPLRIECFDNSNIQGSYPVAACVVFDNGRPNKKEYRHFNIKTVVGPDDFASMREVLHRRYSRQLKEKGMLPNLIVVDGGKGQLSSAVEVLKELNLYDKIAIVGIAKRLEEIYYPDDSVPHYIDKKSESLKVIQRLRDEAHRFGITHHRKKRNKATLKTELHDISGIGESISSKLLSTFKSVKKIRESDRSDLEAVIGAAKAKIVWDYFQKN